LLEIGRRDEARIGLQAAGLHPANELVGGVGPRFDLVLERADLGDGPRQLERWLSGRIQTPCSASCCRAWRRGPVEGCAPVARSGFAPRKRTALFGGEEPQVVLRIRRGSRPLRIGAFGEGLPRAVARAARELSRRRPGCRQSRRVGDLGWRLADAFVEETDVVLGGAVRAGSRLAQRGSDAVFVRRRLADALRFVRRATEARGSAFEGAARRRPVVGRQEEEI
jgi:hypothetical protein